jgi:catechol 2,3-dioxygenase-like lactoylglutathione lyase family enzyme
VAVGSGGFAAGVIALGECMRARLGGKVTVIGNWADSQEIRPLPFPEGALTVLYSGNLGLAHDVDTVLAAMKELRADGRGVLFIGPRAATPARIVERFGCGWQVECGDVAGCCGG